jgi:glucose-induced degradation protein 8
MALLLFPAESLEPQIAALLSPNLRRDAADSVNKAILERQSRRRDAAIRKLVRMRTWAENAARDKGMALPERLDIGLHGDDADNWGHHGLSSENGHEPMVTT